MKCTVTLDNGIDGIIKSKGQLSLLDDSFALCYELDGDECVLRYSGGEITQTRRGSVELELLFSEGKQTLCTLGSGSLLGTFPVYTENLRVKTGDDGVTVFLSYVCAGERKNLEINAEIIR